MPKTFKKLVLVLATSAPMTKASKKDELMLERVPCIYYSFRFQKDNAEVKALINSSNEVNAMTLTHIAKLGLKVYHTNVGA